MATPEVAQQLALIAPWLRAREPFILVGPEGCGKSTLLEYCFRRLMGVSVAVVNCSSQTSAANVIQKLVQVRACYCVVLGLCAAYWHVDCSVCGCAACVTLRWRKESHLACQSPGGCDCECGACGPGLETYEATDPHDHGSQVCGKPVTTNTGKCLRPHDNGRVILYLKDINLPRCDLKLVALPFLHCATDHTVPRMYHWLRCTAGCAPYMRGFSTACSALSR